MTREERLGLWIIALFGLAGAAFYGAAIGPGYIRLVRTGEAAASTDTEQPAGDTDLDHAVRPRFGTLTGRLLDRRSHAPVADGSITVVGLAHVAAPRIQQSPDGTFRIGGLPLGKTFELVFAHAGYESRRSRHRLDREAARDLGLIELERFVLVEGRVRDAFGQGIIGARLSWYPPLPHYSLADADGRRMALATLLAGPIPPRRQVFTDRSGRFSFGEAPPGPLDLAATAPGFGTALVRDVDLRHRTARRYVEIQLQPAPDLSGTLIDGDGRPLAGATLVAIPRQSTAMWRRSATDQSGHFRFDELPAGDWALGAVHPDCAPTDLGDVQTPGEEVTLTMARSPTRWRLDRPLAPGWWLDLLPGRGSGGIPRLHWSGTLADRLAPGSGTVTAVWQARATIPMTAVLTGARPSVRLIPPARDPSGPHALQFTDAETGDGVAGASIHVILDGLVLASLGESDENGALTLQSSSQPGTMPLSLLVLAPGYEPQQFDWTTASPPTRLRLTPAPILEVHVQRYDGEAEPHAILHVAPVGSTPHLEAIRRLRPRMLAAETDPEGTATLASPTNGAPWRLVVRGEHGRAAVGSETVSRHLSEQTRLDCRLAASSWVSGTIRDDQGLPVAGVRVTAALPEDYAIAPTTLEPPPVVTVVSGPDGRYDMGPLVPGVEIVLRAGGRGRRAARSIPALDPAARIVSFDLTLEPD